MGRRVCFATTTGLAMACCALLGGGAACVGSGSGPTPVPSLATTPAAAAFFASLRDGLRRPDRVPPLVLRAEIESFLRGFPSDGLVPLAHVYLALVALQLGDTAAADRELELGNTLPPGSTRDLRTVAMARRARLQGQAEEALNLLRPLVGKSVDPVIRSVFEQELTLAALGTHRDYEAISYMDAWLRASSEEDADQTARAVAALVEKVPKEVLVGSLQAMRAQRATLGYGIDIERILERQLVQIATTSGDAELAQLLLDQGGTPLAVPGDAGAVLGELATSRRGMNVVTGRTLGVLLPTELPALRDEAADVLRGVLWALGLPHGVRSAPADAGAPAAARADAGVSPLRAACGDLEPAPLAEEPKDEDDVRLVTRDDAGSADRTEGALDELAGEGAGVIVAGLDPQTSAHALSWGQARGIAIVAIVPPAPSTALPGPGDWSFVLGEPRARAIEVLAKAVPGLQGVAVAPVVDASEVGSFPAQGGPMGAMTLGPPVSCDIPAVRAGDPRFPLGVWDHDRARAWLVTGSPMCARDLLAELSSARVSGTVGLTLEAAALPAHAASLKVMTAAAGVVPQAASGDVRDDELRRFAERLGQVGWWTALGRDAATLARLALRPLPPGTVAEPKLVTQLRAKARDELASARARLWTTETSGFAAAPAGHAVTRTVCAVDVPPRP
jgi:hypothetical protein